MYTYFENIWAGHFKSLLHYTTEFSPLRKTECYEFEFYITENGSSFIDGTEYKHKCGGIFFAEPGQKRFSRGVFECFAIHFRCKDDIFERNILKKLSAFYYLPEAETAFKKIINSNETNDVACELAVTSALLDVISKIFECYPITESGIDIKYMEIVKNAADYIKLNYSKPITLADLYKSGYISRSVFFSVFKEITGYTPCAFINTVRIERAKNMLADTNLPIADIAQECGFCSQSYFNCIFKNKTGVTPFKYRQKRFEKFYG